MYVVSNQTQPKTWDKDWMLGLIKTGQSWWAQYPSSNWRVPCFHNGSMQFEVHLTFTINKIKLILCRAGVAQMVWAHTVLHIWSRVRGPPMLVDLHKYIDQKHSVPLLTSSGQQALHQRNPLHTGKYASQGSTLALKPRADITRSPKLGYHWLHKMNLSSLKITNKNKILGIL